jgi:uncharacterized glyoxalase superfamily protein PhnB
MKFTGICLNTKNVLGLADFYTQVLGAKAEGDDRHTELHGENVDMALFSHAGMEEMAPGSMQGAGSGSVTLMFEVADVDAEYDRLQKMGVSFVKPPQTHPWGARSFWFKDPDGNIVDFFTNLRS